MSTNSRGRSTAARLASEASRAALAEADRAANYAADRMAANDAAFGDLASEAARMLAAIRSRRAAAEGK